MEKDGFTFTQMSNDEWYLQLDSARLEESARYCQEHGVRALHISPYHGYLLPDLDCLSLFPGIRSVHLQNSANREIADFEGLYAATELTHLGADFPTGLHFSRFPRLSSLTTHYEKSTIGSLSAATTLTCLLLSMYKAKDLEALRPLRRLEFLGIYSSPLQSLESIGDLPALREMTVAYCSKLTSLRPLTALARHLKFLGVYSCKNVTDLHEVLGTLTALRKIILLKGTSLPSLDFVSRLPDLEFLSFDDTNILDGDMTPCLSLKYTGFMNKRHYSHTWKEVRAFQPDLPAGGGRLTLEG